MKNLTRLVLAVTSTLLLASGLLRASQALDPVSLSTGHDITVDQKPCDSCTVPTVD